MYTYNVGRLLMHRTYHAALNDDLISLQQQQVVENRMDVM